ncbi:hypothetical protein ANCDUO_13901 [Ancylostoma duodenale]|uniref:Uncharacterized protein n=1 Tax=Ancylostoma duodenale TaxID=51022 RepID=A0A0C2G4N4_9BILA|nr:hypothetical protein ANCDUO_13901 [Ancylostoma duodenale]
MNPKSTSNLFKRIEVQEDDRDTRTDGSSIHPAHNWAFWPPARYRWRIAFAHETTVAGDTQVERAAKQFYVKTKTNKSSSRPSKKS